MDLLKKLAGIFLLLFAALLSLATIVSAFNSIIEIKEEINESTSEGLGYAFGSILVTVLFAAIIFFMAKFGMKLIRRKAVEVGSIDEIGA